MRHDSHAITHFSVIVPTRNAGERLGEQLRALAEQQDRHGFELIVVDDHSAEPSRTLLAAWAKSRQRDDVHVVWRSRCGGANASRNSALAVATGAWLLFCDGDDLVDQHWFSCLARACNDPWVLAAGRIEVVGPQAAYLRFPVPGDAWGHPYAYGGNMAVSRTALTAVGGFDEAMRAGGTEIDLALRLRKAGATVRAVPDAVVHYHVPRRGGLFRRSIRKQQGYAYINARHGPVIPSRSLLGHLEAWAWLMRHALHRRDDREHAEWWQLFGQLVGRVAASARYRTVFL